MVPQLGYGEPIGGATSAIECLGGDVVLHHDARIQGGKVEFVEALVHSDFRFERESATIAPQEILGVLEILRARSEEHTSELQSHHDLVCRLLLEKKKTKNKQ